MASLKQIRGAQWALDAEFIADLSTAANDSMATTVGNTIGGAAPAYNAAVVPIGGVATNVFEVIGLPPNAIVIGGAVTVESAVVGPTASTISIGDLNNATRYASAVSLLAAGRTALTLNGYRGVGENLRITVSNSVAAATAGKFTVRILYVVTGRVNEVQAS